MRFAGAEIDIYPVGLLAAWQRFVHEPYRPVARRHLRSSLRYAIRQMRARNWRAVKNWLNGYLAEPREFPLGLTRCGRGWTRGRAYRDLQQRITAAEQREGE